MRRRRDDSSLFYLHSTYSNPAGLSIVGLASMKKKKALQFVSYFNNFSVREIYYLRHDMVSSLP